MAAAQGWAALENSPAGQYQLALAQDADAYTYNVAPLKDGLVHTEDQASHDGTQKGSGNAKGERKRGQNDFKIV
ncbi:MAG: hypothetical protein ACREHD_24980, partial [Pirellulales bacterium]